MYNLTPLVFDNDDLGLDVMVWAPWSAETRICMQRVLQGAATAPRRVTIASIPLKEAASRGSSRLLFLFPRLALVF